MKLALVLKRLSECENTLVFYVGRKNSGYCQTRYGNVWVFTTYGNSELSSMKRKFGSSPIICLSTNYHSLWFFLLSFDSAKFPLTLFLKCFTHLNFSSLRNSAIKLTPIPPELPTNKIRSCRNGDSHSSSGYILKSAN